MVHVVIAIILNAEGQVLIAQRSFHQEKGGMWEFPGGKVEINESGYDALVRELQEEIGIQITAADPWMKVEYDYPHKSVLLDTWMVRHYEGMPIGAEGQPIAWCALEDLKNYQFPEGNLAIIQKLMA
jgi:8-oxo-dGTP diphosphatase